MSHLPVNAPACTHTHIRTSLVCIQYTKLRLNSFTHKEWKQQEALLMLQHILYVHSPDLFFFFHLHYSLVFPLMLLKSLQAPDSCGSQTNDFICVSLSTLLFWAPRGSTVILPLLPFPQPPTSQPPLTCARLSCSCFAPHSCWGVTEARWSHTPHVFASVLVGWGGDRRLVWGMVLGAWIQAQPFCGEIFFQGHDVGEKKTSFMCVEGKK